MNKFLRIALTAALVFCLGCAGYEYKPVPFKAADAYPNHVVVAGAVVAARAWSNSAEAEKAFGFNIRAAGLTPVQVVVDNKSAQPLMLEPNQTLLRDAQDNLWNVLPAQVAYERIDKHVRVERLGGEAARQGGLAAVAGAVLGAAFGIVTDQDVAEAAAKGAAAGAAVGAVKGGMEGYNDPRSRSRISNDLKNKSLKDKPFPSHEITHGFLFFPGEVKEPSLLRLKIHEVETGKDHILELSFKTESGD